MVSLFIVRPGMMNCLGQVAREHSSVHHQLYIYIYALVLTKTLRLPKHDHSAGMS